MWLEKRRDQPVLVRIRSCDKLVLDHPSEWCVVQGVCEDIPDRVWRGDFRLEGNYYDFKHIAAGNMVLLHARDIQTEKFIGYTAPNPYRAYRELERWLGIGVLDHEGP